MTGHIGTEVLCWMLFGLYLRIFSWMILIFISMFNHLNYTKLWFKKKIFYLFVDIRCMSLKYNFFYRLNAHLHTYLKVCRPLIFSLDFHLTLTQKLNLTDTCEDSKLVHRQFGQKWTRVFSPFFQRVWLSAELKILASTFGRFGM